MITAPVLPLLVPFLLILTRIGATLLLLPSFSSANGTLRIKFLLAATMACLLTPLYIRADLLSITPASLFFMIESELLVGCACGLSGRLVLLGLQVGGQLVGHVSGISLSEFTQGDESTNTAHGRLFVWIGVGTFLVAGGHRQVIQALLDSFQLVTPGTLGSRTELIHLLQDAGGMAFELALRVTAPILVAMLVALIAVAMLNRTLPQLNIMALGHNLNALLLFVVLLCSLGGVAWVFQGQVAQALEQMSDALRDATMT